ncbi:cytochrome c3 family protein [Geobacter sp. AOG2]|uniref:cytochrome c3 family protein n=1 Tax=Geobacter sp. AOG2 TaxID=1566347 RepID=UPI001CC63BC0|nr:cytochrome c3 family protein [Geobacter sp. AOG2]GFE59873.1 hypothetical protein AOG2_04610 [Geobacter sp. AOG2]
MNYRNMVYPVIVIGLLVKMPAAEGAGMPARESCVTASCHAAIGTLKFVHGPVAVGDCLTCHVKKGKHSFQPINDVTKLCISCHDLSNGATHLHDMRTLCTKCHDPHQSDRNFQLRAQAK